MAQNSKKLNTAFAHLRDSKLLIPFGICGFGKKTIICLTYREDCRNGLANVLLKIHTSTQNHFFDFLIIPDIDLRGARGETNHS